ncbi:unnamed protein product [Miscanthus lutarioriparius]|uniref:Uncharacterized protein n=1 Tax=Miscanthus lutarioriparius TaxID=422564 RepID=A0A811P7N6_9POAL|nr:unnamed protein product [Miscanthus lutarioriparius]
MAEMEPSNGNHMAEDQPTPVASAAEEAAMDADTGGERRSAVALVGLLRGFLAVQQRRAEAYSTLRRFLKTAKIQVLKKAGRPSERLVNHEDCRSRSMAQHVCVHVKEITEADADAEYDAALKEAIQGVQEAVTSINEHMEEVRYEIDGLEGETIGSKWSEVEEAFPGTLSLK